MATVAYYCFLECHILPHEFNQLPDREKALIIAMIQLKAESDRKEARKLKREVEHDSSRYFKSQT